MSRVADVVPPIFVLTATFLIVKHGSDWLATIVIFASFFVVGILLVAYPSAAADSLYIPKRLRGTDYQNQLTGIIRILGLLFAIFGLTLVTILLINRAGGSN